MGVELLFGLLPAAALAYAGTPIAMRAAVRLHFLDKPVGYKGHAKPTPYLGGSAVVAAFAVVVLVAAGHPDRTLPVVFGALALWAVGTTDDRRNLSPYLRLGIEFAVAGALWALGLGWDLGFGPAVDLVVTALWVAGVVNAFNLFDNMDGAAGTMACVVSLAVAILGIVQGDTWLAVCGGALCGACLGFLPYNLCAPPRIFLGDGGSMPIGFVVAALVMIGSSGAVREWQALAMALLLVGIPMLDTCLVVISRRRRGLSVLTGGRDHLTHRTRRRVTTVRSVAFSLGSAQALLAVLALAAYRGGSVVLVIVVAGYVLAAALAIEVLDAGFSDERADTEPEVRRPPPTGQRTIAAGLIGLILGLSPFYDGGYDSALWVPAGLVVIALLLALAVGSPVRPSAPGRLMLAASVGLAGWSLLSVLWSSSPELGFVASNRLLLLAAMLGVLLLVVCDTRSALAALGGATGGAVIVGVWTIGVMLVGDGPGLFSGQARLNEPLGYVNAQGGVYVLALMALLSLAEWRRSPRLAAAGAGLGTLCGGLALLSQSRGVLLAVAGGLFVVFALWRGRLRRAAAAAAIFVPLAVVSPWLLRVSDRASPQGGAAAGDVRMAALLLVVAALMSGLSWWAVVHIQTTWTPQGRRRARTAWGGALVACAVLAAGVAIAREPSIETRVRTQYHAFIDLGTGPESAAATRSRLVSGSGARYDYWRIAWHAWQAHPLVGLGAGGYQAPYYRERQTSEAINQPHSIELQTLSELGLVGMALLLVWLGAIGWATARARRSRVGEVDAHVLVAGSGIFLAWLAQTSGDWLHLLPGVTGVALIAVAVVARGDIAPAPEPAAPPAPLRRRRALRVAGALAVALAVTVGLVSLSREALSEHYRTRAQQALARGAAPDALELADRSLRIDPDAVAAYYLRAAALDRLGRRAAARSAFDDALREEPENFVTWALIGDLEARLGDPAAARRAYARASALNPRDPALAHLAQVGT